MAASTSKSGEYDAVYKELDKFDTLYASPSTKSKPTKSKTKPIASSLDGLLAALRDAKEQLASGSKGLDEVSLNVNIAVEGSKKEIEDRQKEAYNSLNRLGKALDKKFTESLPNYGVLFSSPESSAALDRVIAMHFLRTGSYGVAETFINEGNVQLAPNTLAHFKELRQIVEALRESTLEPALQWCNDNRSFLEAQASPLELHLHQSAFMRLLLSSPDPSPALSYARMHFPPLYASHSNGIKRLLSALTYLPASRLATSPYADLLSERIHEDLPKEFAESYCAWMRLSKELPLRVVGDLGGGGALGMIERGRKVMLERKTEWSAEDEIPVEITVPPRNRYHSIFACPVSKEQATESNPPVMLTCGHVLAKESVLRLAKNGARVKCPYCPVESTAPAQRVWF